MWKPTVSSDELYHHGILGMRWGKKNGPPYPLGAEDHSESEKKAGWRKSLTDEQKATLKKAATGVLIVGGVALGAYAISQHPELLDYAKSGAQIVKDNFSEKTVEEIAKDSTNITEKGKDFAKEISKGFDKTNAASDALFEKFKNDPTINVYKSGLDMGRAKKAADNVTKIPTGVNRTIYQTSKEINTDMEKLLANSKKLSNMTSQSYSTATKSTGVSDYTKELLKKNKSKLSSMTMKDLKDLDLY